MNFACGPELNDCPAVAARSICIPILEHSTFSNRIFVEHVLILTAYDRGPTVSGQPRSRAKEWGVLSTGSVTAGRFSLPPSLLFRTLPGRGAVPSLSPFDSGRSERRGARNRLRIGNFM